MTPHEIEALVLCATLGGGAWLAAWVRSKSKRHRKQWREHTDEEWDNYAKSYHLGEEEQPPQSDWEQWPPEFDDEPTQPRYPTHPAGPGPLDEWRNQMSKVTNIPTSVMHNNAPVVEGDLLLFTDGSGRQVKVLDPEPDESGGILVQENYRAEPAMLGCTVVEQHVILDLSPQEARAILRLASGLPPQGGNPGTSAPTGATATGTNVSDTAQFARPVLDDLRNSLNPPKA